MVEKTRVLVVDDEPQIVRALTLNLHALGYEVSSANSGEEALIQASQHRPDAVILDLGLPGIDGIEVIRGLRGWTGVPVIVLSVREDEREKIAALEAGADDYVTKPFGMGELVARLRAALRRAVDSDRSVPLIETSAFVIDLGAKRVTRPGGEEIRLTPTEWGIVEMLALNEGKLISQVQLLKDVWGPTYGEETNYLRVFMAQIRRKLEPDPAAPRYFKTEPGMGYRFDNADGAAGRSPPQPPGPTL
ncbi:MAG: response regulator [Acidimicrobiia bacterium]